MELRVAYIINQYPHVSHTFIRREIMALERQGVRVERIAVRGWDSKLVDVEDIRERQRTRYLLRYGVAALVVPLLLTALTAPASLFAALLITLRMGNRADRPLPYHLVYLAQACRILRWLRVSGTTHVHAHFGTNSTELAMLVHELGGPPFSFTVHGPEEFDKPEFLHLGEKIRRAAFVVAISSFGRSQLFRWVSHSHWAKINVVHCGLEPTFRAEEPIATPAVPRLICVGRICAQKGQLLLIDAVAALARRGITFELGLAGDGEMRGEVEELVRASGLDSRVRITGWISSDQVRSEILAARALVLPSFAEGLPVVIMEAMALHRPVITTFVAGIPELVRQGEGGWLVPAGDVDELARAIEACLTTPAEELTRMARAAHTRVLARHSVDIEASKLATLFKMSASGDQA